MWHAHDGMGWWMVFGSVWVVLFWVLIAWLIYSVFARGGRGSEERRRDETPMEIAERRYASGEISREEFEQIRETLRSGGTPTRPSG